MPIVSACVRCTGERSSQSPDGTAHGRNEATWFSGTATRRFWRRRLHWEQVWTAAKCSFTRSSSALSFPPSLRKYASELNCAYRHIGPKTFEPETLQHQCRSVVGHFGTAAEVRTLRHQDVMALKQFGLNAATVRIIGTDTSVLGLDISALVQKCPATATATKTVHWFFVQCIHRKQCSCLQCLQCVHCVKFNAANRYWHLASMLAWVALNFTQGKTFTQCRHRTQGSCVTFYALHASQAES